MSRLDSGAGIRVAAPGDEMGSAPAARAHPLCYCQRSVWLLEESAPGTALYNFANVIDLVGALEIRCLWRALQRIVERHDALRLVFRSGERGPEQRVIPRFEVECPLEDLSGLPAEERKDRLAERIQEVARQPLDLGSGPLFRFRLFRLSATEHQLLAVMHHLVADGRSRQLFIEELAAIYGGEEPPPLPVQYQDLAVWQNQQLESGGWAEHERYWARQWRGYRPGPLLPADRPRSPSLGAPARNHVEHLSPELTHGLLRLREERGTSHFRLMLSVFNALLYRLTGTRRVVLGVPFAGRVRSDTSALIGFFSNTLPCWVEVDEDLPFCALLEQVDHRVEEMARHQCYPNEKVNELAAASAGEPANLYSMVFTQYYGLPEVEADGLRLSGDLLHLERTQFELIVYSTVTPEGIRLTFEHSAALFDAVTIQRLAGRLRRMAEAVAADPERRVGELPVVSDSERAQLLRAWNDTGSAFPGERSIHELFGELAAARPDRTALTCGAEVLSYGALDRRAEGLAGRLRRLGVGPEVRVGLAVERSAEAVVAILAILKAGGVYVPLDLSYPRRRLAFILEDSGAGMVLLGGGRAAEVAELAASLGKEVLELAGDGAAALPPEPPAQTPPAQTPPAQGPPALADNLAYVMYTSGSTGRPKGVAVTHRAVVRLVRGSRFASLAPEEVFLQFAPLAFDASTLELWGPLLNGGRMVVYAPRNPALEELGAVLARHRVTTLWLTAGLFHQMVEACPWSFGGVRQLLAGGDVLASSHVRRALEAMAGGRLINGYGPTEGTTFTCCGPLSRLQPEAPSVPIGRPVANSTAYVLDWRARPAALGAVGELYIGGAGLARGYLDRPARTAERFVPHPLSPRPGERLYRSGDLVRHGHDGRLEFVGRLDEQVKLRGFRVEPGEVEAALARLPGVVEAAVVAREVGGETGLAAYVVLEGGEGAGGEDEACAQLRRALGEQLPEYMVPAAMVPLAALPLTPNGKVDRRALPAPEAARLGRAAVSAAASSPTEEILAGLWMEVLGLEGVGVEESFFALGGHSLKATRLASQIRRIFPVDLGPGALFDHPTIAALARRIDEAMRGERAVEVPAVVAVPRGEDLPLSYAQQRLWLIDQMEGGSPFYNVPAALDLRGELVPSLLAAGLAEILRRHEALRTHFRMQGTTPVQVVSEPWPWTLPVVDLQGLPAASRGRQADRLARELGRRPFDLNHGPLIRACLLRLEPARHLLALTLHHIVADGWSMEILARELLQLYEAGVSGGRPELPPLPVQYPDFAHWQRRWLTDEVLEPQLAYWRRQLAGAPPVLELPCDRPRPPLRSFRGARVPIAFEPEVIEALRHLARGHEVTLFMALVGAFGVLLSRHAGTEDVVMGAPVAGRTRPEIEGLIGFFVNMLVLRLDLGGSPSFEDLLGRVRAMALAAYQHQDTPFEKLVEVLQAERERSRNPLFQVALSLETVPRLGADGLAAELDYLDWGVSHFDLTLELREEVGGEIAGDLVYSTDLFDATTARRMVRHLEAVAAGVAAEPGRGIGDLALLTVAERAQLLREWNATATAYPADLTVPELFERAAERAPDATALELGEEWMSYGELRRRASGLAHLLRGKGVGAEVRVGISMGRSAAMVVAMLGVLEAGGAYVPLDPADPPERLSLLMEDAGIRVLIVGEGSLPVGRTAAGSSIQVVDLHREEGAVSGPSPGPFAVAATADNLAYVIYTSGSTGKPKGVAVVHRAIARLVRETDYVRLGPADRMAQASTASFDAATFEIWGALANGARVVGIPREVVLSPQRLVGDLRRRAVTTLFLTTALFHRLAEEIPAGFESLDHLLFGGEAVDPARVARVLGAGPPGRLLHVYGPTESTTFTSWFEVHRVPAGAETVAIGRPLANTEIYVLDRALRPSPLGVPGELSIGGAGLARAYLDRPRLTAARFVPHPAAEVPGCRLYRTGDLVRQRSDGAIEFLGRFDHQVKLRGFRIELGEIETALRRHPSVRQVAVVMRREAADDARLVAYLAPATDAPEPRHLTVQLRDYLKESLPTYMVPGALVVLEALPLTSSGKVDRRSLPAPESGAEARGAGFEAPRTPAEEVLAGIWCELLRVDRVSRDDDFFDIGGHSLLATQVVARVQGIFQVDFPIDRFFDDSTLAGLARSVEELSRGGKRSEVPEIRRLSRRGPLPLSYAQQRLWFIDQMEGGSPFYNLPVALELKGELDRGALAASYGEILRRHESLRTSFQARGEEPVQVIAPPEAGELPLIDLTVLAPAARRPAADRVARWDAGRPFDLARGPVVRAFLLQLAPTHHALVVNMHHIVSDGWSVGLLVRELGTLYRRFTRGIPWLPPRPAVQYPDFAAWQRQWLRGDALAARLEYWRQRLTGAPPVLPLPLDRPRPRFQSYRGARCPMALDAPLSRAIEELAHRRGATLFMTLLAAFDLLLSRWSGHHDVVVGSPISGRNHAELEGLIGFFVNMLVLRVDLSGRPDFETLLERVKEVALGAYLHQDAPFEQLVETLQPERDPGRNPLFQVVFTLQNEPPMEVEVEALRMETIYPDWGATHFDLTLELVETPEGLAGSFDYNVDLFDATTVRRMARHLRVLLEGIAADPRRPVADLPLMTPTEEHQLLSEWGDGRPAEGGALPGGLVAEQAAARPDAVAATCRGHWLSYGELHRRAAGVAAGLAARGRGGEAVAVLGHRGLDLLAVMLGIDRAGAIYLPLEPEHPDARLRRILEDSGARRLLAPAGEAPRARDLARGLDLEALSWRDLLAAPEGGGGHPPPPEPDPRQVANIFYTSGSTGAPKGAMVEQAGMLNHLRAKVDLLGLGPASVVAQNASAGFDISIWQLWAPLLVGGRVVIYDDQAVAAVDRFLARVERDGVTVLETVPSLLEIMLAKAEPELALPGLRFLISNAETLPPALARGWRKRFPGVPLINTYGATECSDDVTHEVFRRGLPAGAERVGVGRPIGGMGVQVLDRWLRPVGLGCPGQLTFTGVGVGRGYLGDAAKTARTFVPDPFSGASGARMYLTGDLGRWTARGALDLLGRLDHQVKVRGHRIELGEVEAAVLRHPAVRQAVVLAREGASGRRRLVAYVVMEGDLDRASLRESLRDHLPAYMVPEQVVALGEVPLTPNGKVDRRALPEPEEQRAEYTPPRDELEARIAGIWQEVLEVEEVGIEDDFFELGGHSLMSVHLVSRMRSELGVEVSLKQLFTAPTVAMLAAYVREQGAGPGSEAVRVEPRAERPHYPLSPSQTAFWFQVQMAGEAGVEVPDALRLEGPLDLDAWTGALRDLLERHEILRTRFEELGGEPVQTILEGLELEAPLYDLSGYSGREQEERLGEYLSRQVGRPFDLSRPPLLRASLVRLAADEHLFFMNLPHIASDGWTEQLLLDELAELYNARCQGRDPVLPAKALRYVDFVLYQQEQMEGAELAGQRELWVRRFEDCGPPLELPDDAPAAGEGAADEAPAPVILDRELTARVRELGARRGATLFMLVLTALKALLARWTGATDLILGTVVSGRSRADFNGVAGPFVNPLMLRTDLGSDARFVEMLERVKETTLAALAHQDVPFHAWLEPLRRARGESGWLPSSIWFFLDDKPAQPRLEGLEAERIAPTRLLPRMGLDQDFRGRVPGQQLTVGALDGGDEVELITLNVAGKFERRALHRLRLQLKAVLEQVTREPRLRLSQLDLIPEGERTRLESLGAGAPGPTLAPGLLELVAMLPAAAEGVAARSADGSTFAATGVTAADPYELARRLAGGGVTELVAPDETLRRLEEVLPRVVDRRGLHLERILSVGGGIRPGELALLESLAAVVHLLPLGADEGRRGGLWTEARGAGGDGSSAGGGFSGYPLPGASLRVVDRWRQPVPAGVVGEICLLPGAGGGDSPRATGWRGTWRLDGRLVAVEPAPGAVSGTRAGAEAGAGRRRAALLPEQAFVPPQSALERRLAEVWRQVLAVDAVGVDDDFFALGGSALAAVRASEALAARDVLAAPAQIAGERTVAAVARVVEAAMAPAGAESQSEGPAPLTPLQRELLRATADAPRPPAVSLALQAPGPIAPDLLEGAVTRLVNRHEALRGRFVEEGGLPAQVQGAAAVVVEHVDLGSVAGGEREAAWEAAVRRQAERIDPAAGPLLRIVHGRWPGERGSTVALVASSLGLDEPSLVILAGELAALSSDAEAAVDPGSRFHAWLPAAERLAAYREAAGGPGWGSAVERVMAPYEVARRSLPAAEWGDLAAGSAVEKVALLAAAVVRALPRSEGSAPVRLGVEWDHRWAQPAPFDLSSMVGQLGTLEPRRLTAGRDGEAAELYRLLRRDLEAGGAEGEYGEVDLWLRFVDATGHPLEGGFALLGEPCPAVDLPVPAPSPVLRLLAVLTPGELLLTAAHQPASKRAADALLSHLAQAIQEVAAAAAGSLTSRVFGFDAASLDLDDLDRAFQ